MDTTSMEVLDLSNPSVLRNLVENGPTGAFITEIMRFDDSDMEESDDEATLSQTNVLPIHRRGLDLEEEEEDEEEEDERRDGEWRHGASTPATVAFTGDQGLQIEMEEAATPMDYLALMINNDMMGNIVTETNRYAAETLRDKQLSPSSRFRKWVDVTLGEMWAFFGLIIAMGLIVIDDLDDYWSTDGIYNLPLFRSVMKRDRFCLILSFLHICNNGEQRPRDHPDHDPLFKVRKFVAALKKNFMRAFQPGRNVAIDEAMVAWRGPLAFRVYNPDKPDKFGVKIFELCDSETGYCSNLEFYTGRRVCSVHGATYDVVHRLITPYLGCGRTLYVDNYYTSHDLFTSLKESNTLACGTLRLNRKHGPPKAMIPKLKKTSAAVNLTNGSLNLLRFFDKREVNVLTTAHDGAIIATGKINPVTKEPILKHRAVADYNRYMGAVDRSDQMVSYNAFKRRTLKWWKKVFFHMFTLGVLNAFIVQKATAAGKKLAHRMFRRELAKQLIAFSPFPLSSNVRPSELGDTSLLRLSARHFPELIAVRPGSNTKNPQRDCAVCSEKVKRQKSRYECPSCDVGLHVVPCFKLYHTSKDFKRALKRKRQESE